MAQDLHEGCALLKEAAQQIDAVQTRLDVANRRLLAAQIEIKRYQSQLLAYERLIGALRRENAELERQCRELCARGISEAQKSAAVPVFNDDAGQSPVQQRAEANAAASELPAAKHEKRAAAKTDDAEQRREPQQTPKHSRSAETELERLSFALLDWFDNCLAD